MTNSGIRLFKAGKLQRSRSHREIPWRIMLGLCAVAIAGPGAAEEANLPDIVKKIKPSIVAVGTFQKTRKPPGKFLGTGFVVANGNYVVTNEHVFPKTIDRSTKEEAVIFVGRGRSVTTRKVTKVAEDAAHDVAILRFKGPSLPALTFANPDEVEEGQLVAFTGFPIGSVLGFFPVTHRGIVSAITPIAIPSIQQKQLDPKTIKRLRKAFNVFQLDATAYPGNSGSPLYNPRGGTVYGIVSSVFVKESKENLLSNPSGITYAVPISYARKLLQKIKDLK